MSNDKIIFNFFNKNTTLNSLCNHFDLDPSNVKEFIFLCAKNDYSPLDFVKKYNINLIKTDVSNVYLTCKHVTTANDNLESFKKYGLLNLEDALTYNTLLRNFLFDNNITIDTKDKTLSYKKTQIKLFRYEEDCAECIYGKCKHDKRRWDGTVDITHKNICCEHTTNLIPLCIKLFSHKAELEVHLVGNDENIKKYSCVNRSPEILLTLNETLKKVFNTPIDLSRLWECQQNKIFYILEFDVNINSFECINTKKYFEQTYYYEDYLETCGLNLEDVDEELVPSCFFSNIFIIEKAIKAINSIDHTCYGQIFPDTIVEFNNLRITKHDY